MMMIRLCIYFGLGFLAHWLWIGTAIDPANTFTWVCLLLGPLMCLAYLLSKLFWLGVAMVVLAIIIFIMWLFVDEIDAWMNRRKRQKLMQKRKIP